MKIDIDINDLDRGNWEEVDSFMARCYGPNGDELGSVPVSVCAATLANEDDSDEYYVVAETPDECTNFHGVYTTREEAEEAANDLCVEQDETPDLDDVMAEIKETGYFTDPDIIPLVVKAATQYSQGYLLVTPDISQPVGTAWTTNGYLQCDYIALDATYSTEEEAAEALLNAIQGQEDEDES